MNIHITSIMLISLGISISGQDFMQYLLGGNLLKQQVLCLLDNHPCDAFGSQLQRLLPLLIQDDCGRCNPQQQAYFNKMIYFMQRRYPEEWQAIKEKYNLPERTARSFNDEDVNENVDKRDDELYIDDEDDTVEVSECVGNDCL